MSKHLFKTKPKIISLHAKFLDKRDKNISENSYIFGKNELRDELENLITRDNRERRFAGENEKIMMSINKHDRKIISENESFKDFISKNKEFIENQKQILFPTKSKEIFQENSQICNIKIPDFKQISENVSKITEISINSEKNLENENLSKTLENSIKNTETKIHSPAIIKQNFINISYKSMLRYIDFCELVSILLKNGTQIQQMKFINILSDIIYQKTGIEPKCEEILGGIYEKICENENLEELWGGLAVLCKGKMEMKIRFAFKNIKGCDDIYITLPGLIIFLKSVYKIMEYENCEKNQSEKVENTAKECFDDIMKGNYVGKILVAEFMKWFSSNSKNYNR